MKYLILTLVIVVVFIHGFYVPLRAFPDNLPLAFIYSILSGTCISFTLCSIFDTFFD